LGWSTTEQTLHETFSPYGKVSDTTVLRDPHTGHSRGFGFVTFDHQHEAQAAINGLHGKELNGKRIIVNAVHHH